MAINNPAPKYPSNKWSRMLYCTLAALILDAFGIAAVSFLGR